MNRVLATVALVLVGAAPPSPVDALAGRYSRSFPNAMVSGERYTSEDIVEVVPVDARHAYLRFELAFFNGHSCSLYGIAQASGRALTYRAPADDAGGPHCTLILRRSGGRLAWDDAGGSCSDHCGARGSMTGALPWASRRPIRYLPRLRASRQFRAALTEWQTGRPVTP